MNWHSFIPGFYAGACLLCTAATGAGQSFPPGRWSWTVKPTGTNGYMLVLPPSGTTPTDRTIFVPGVIPPNKVVPLTNANATNLFSLRQALDRPAPGVYKAEPFTAIVVVPGPHPDDKAVAGGASLGEVDPRMPMAEPYLRLIPRGQPRK